MSARTLHITVKRSAISLTLGDITLQDTDAIVNAANSGLLGGGGVDGAIHRAGGAAIMEECKEIRRKQGGCPTGEAVITTGGNLKARYVIHTVGPVWRGGGENEDALLAHAYRNSMALAVRHGVRSIAFPSISTGVYGFPFVRAARIAFETVRNILLEGSSLSEVRFIAFSQPDFEAYAALFTPGHSG